MNHHTPQLDRPNLTGPSHTDTCGRRLRRLGNCEMCLIVLVVLILHWTVMQCIVNWLGGEGALVRAQSSSSSPPMTDDGWRRTSHGWEYKMNEGPKQTVTVTSPTQHISPYHFWPAAAAACMILLITGLPDNKNNSK